MPGDGCIGEIRMFGGNFAPRNWALCDGQLLPISQNQALFSILGTTYGGDGRTSFALPDIRGRVPIHVGNGHREGQKSGEETHTLAGNEMPQHDHVMYASNDTATAQIPAGNVLARSTATDPIWVNPAPLTNMSSTMVANVGGGQAHDNMMPYLAINFCIALRGLFPSRN